MSTRRFGRPSRRGSGRRGSVGIFRPRNEKLRLRNFSFRFYACNSLISLGCQIADFAVLRKIRGLRGILFRAFSWRLRGAGEAEATALGWVGLDRSRMARISTYPIFPFFETLFPQIFGHSAQNPARSRVERVGNRGKDGRVNETPPCSRPRRGRSLRERLLVVSRPGEARCAQRGSSA